LETLIFTILSSAAVLLGVGVVTMRNPISSALSLVGTFFCLAGIYAMLGAHFVAVIQVLVYAGAIMVLFIFVIMLLQLRDEEDYSWSEYGPRIIGGMVVSILLCGALVVALSGANQDYGPVGAEFGTIKQIGYLLFGNPESGAIGKYLLPFEAVSALLTVGVVGAVVLGKRKL